MPFPHPASPPESPSLPLAPSSPFKALTRESSFPSVEARSRSGSGSLPEKVFELRPCQAKPHFQLCAISPCPKPFPLSGNSCLRAMEKSGANSPDPRPPTFSSIFSPHLCSCLSISTHPVSTPSPSQRYLSSASPQPCPSSSPSLRYLLFCHHHPSGLPSQKTLPSSKYATSH